MGRRRGREMEMERDGVVWNRGRWGEREVDGQGD